MESSERPLKILIKTSFVDGWLNLEVTNSGKWIIESDNKGLGTGLANIKSRLEQRYSSKSRLTINKSDNQVQIIIEINYAE